MSTGTKGRKNMKMIIKLVETENSEELINEITEKKFENLEIKTDVRYLEITIWGKFYVQSGMNLFGDHKIWIEDDEHVYLIFKSNDVERIVIKEC